MKKELFNEYLDKRVKLILHTLGSKREEYANEDSVFNNFEKASVISKNEVETVMFNYMLKHFVSLTDIIENIEEEPDKAEFNPDFIEEKIGDIINYLILMEVYIKEYRKDGIVLKKEFMNDLVPCIDF